MQERLRPKPGPTSSIVNLLVLASVLRGAEAARERPSSHTPAAGRSLSQAVDFLDCDPGDRTCAFVNDAVQAWGASAPFEWRDPTSRSGDDGDCGITGVRCVAGTKNVTSMYVWLRKSPPGPTYLPLAVHCDGSLCVSMVFMTRSCHAD